VVFAFVFYAFLYGPLFPWSPIKPGYNHLSLARADVYYAQATTPDPAYSQLGSLIAEADSFHRLPLRKRIRIITCRDWGDFARFVPTLRGRVVGAVTYDTGTVIFVTPKIAERHFYLAEFLRHELSRAVLHQNTTFWAGRGLNTWRYFLHYLIDTRGRPFKNFCWRISIGRKGGAGLQPVRHGL
jgi:hypothetical protein